VLQISDLIGFDLAKFNLNLLRVVIPWIVICGQDGGNIEGIADNFTQPHAAQLLGVPGATPRWTSRTARLLRLPPEPEDDGRRGLAHQQIQHADRRRCLASRSLA
jgi:hypothetical protein